MQIQVIYTFLESPISKLCAITDFVTFHSLCSVTLKACKKALKKNLESLDFTYFSIFYIAYWQTSFFTFLRLTGLLVKPVTPASRNLLLVSSESSELRAMKGVETPISLIFLVVSTPSINGIT